MRERSCEPSREKEPAVMVLIAIASVVCVCAVVPATLFFINLTRYVEPQAGAASGERVAVLIPARDEEKNIGACVESVLKSRDVELEVVVLDDGSTDRTEMMVREIALRDARVRLIAGSTLPAGWNGKQRACWLLAQETSAPLLAFLDADVRLGPTALSRCVAEMKRRDVALLSGFPRQIMLGWTEQMLLPLIHFVLLSFLPMGRMRKTTKVGYAAGCGQFFLADREAYFRVGGHAAIRETRHDGLRLPQAFRRCGLRTDLVDLTKLAEVRMYDSAPAVWMGLAKNATEGLAAPARIVPLTALLLLGQVFPIILGILWVGFCVSNLIVGATFDDARLAEMVSGLVVLAVGASYLPRLIAVWRFKQPLGSAMLHPLGIVMLLAIQWYALTGKMMGRPISWRARSYAASGEEVGEAPAERMR